MDRLALAMGHVALAIRGSRFGQIFVDGAFQHRQLVGFNEAQLCLAIPPAPARPLVLTREDQAGELELNDVDAFEAAS
jgi:hypothetical protein